MFRGAMPTHGPDRNNGRAIAVEVASICQAIPRVPPRSSWRQRGRGMLARLSIRDIVLIDRLDIDFAAGLSVLTGETGAGKSILFVSFSLALGARVDDGLVGPGGEHG